MRKVLLSAAILFTAFTTGAAETATQDGFVTSLTATPLDSHVLLSWTTTGSAIDIYELERSKNGIDFATISRVEPGSVNAEFMETDFQPLDGMSYYRIKVIDSEGNITFSNATPVKFKAGVPVSAVPGKVTAAQNHGPVLIVVRNNAGQEYYSKVEVTSDSDPLLATDLEQRLAAGTYTIVSCSVQEYYSKQVTVK